MVALIGSHPDHRPEPGGNRSVARLRFFRARVSVKPYRRRAAGGFLIVEGKSPLPLEPFRADRFNEGAEA
jgi:hypothetical protein